MMRILQVSSQVLQALVPNQTQIQTFHLGHADQFNNATELYKEIT